MLEPVTRTALHWTPHGKGKKRGRPRIASEERTLMLDSKVDNNINIVINDLAVTSNLIPTGTKLQLFKAAILPYLTYSHLVWHFCRGSNSRKFERVQRKGT